MKQKHHPRTIGYALGIGIAGVAVLSGCASGAGSPRHEPTASSYDNLTTDLSICQKAHQVCADAADGNPTALQVCQDELQQCQAAISAAKTEIHTSLLACVTAARACVAGDGGMTDGSSSVFACGVAFRSCVRAALPPPPPLPPCAAALKECLSGTADGGVVDRRACFETYEQCAISELPPCAQTFAQCLEQGGMFWTCAQGLEQCRQYRMTHDGGLPPDGAFGSTP